MLVVTTLSLAVSVPPKAESVLIPKHLKLYPGEDLAFSKLDKAGKKCVGGFVVNKKKEGKKLVATGICDIAVAHAKAEAHEKVVQDRSFNVTQIAPAVSDGYLGGKAIVDDVVSTTTGKSERHNICYYDSNDPLATVVGALPTKAGGYTCQHCGSAGQRACECTARYVSQEVTGESVIEQFCAAQITNWCNAGAETRVLKYTNGVRNDADFDFDADGYPMCKTAAPAPTGTWFIAALDVTCDAHCKTVGKKCTTNSRAEQSKLNSFEASKAKLTATGLLPNPFRSGAGRSYPGAPMVSGGSMYWFDPAETSFDYPKQSQSSCAVAPPPNGQAICYCEA